MIVRPKAGDFVEVDLAALERKLAEIVRDWRDELREQLVARHGEEAGLKLANRYGRALPAGYIEEVSPAVAATDVDVPGRADRAGRPAPVAVSLASQARAGCASSCIASSTTSRCPTRCR